MTVLFGTHFATPAAIAGLASSWSSSTSWLTLTWTPYGGSASLFWRYRVRRSINGGAYEQIDDDALSNKDVATFVDSDAPHNVPLSYQVTVDNGAYEGAAGTVADQIALQGWWVVVPGDASHSFRILHQNAPADRNPESAMQARYPMGRSTALVTAGVRRRPSGTVRFRTPPTGYSQVDLIREAAQLSVDNGYAVLKTGLGESFRVQMSSPSASSGIASITDGVFEWWAVQ